MEEFTIGESNEKLPYKSQVGALPGSFDKHLTLIAAATGSGKTITKLMFSLVAKLSRMEVVSVHPCSYVKEAKHNIVTLEIFFNHLSEVINLDELSNLIKANNAQGEECKVDLKKKRIIIGKSIEIYQDYYETNGKEHKKSIFDNHNVLIFLDEVQNMVVKGEAYYVMIQLLLLLAS